MTLSYKKIESGANRSLRESSEGRLANAPSRRSIRLRRLCVPPVLRLQLRADQLLRILRVRHLLLLLRPRQLLPPLTRPVAMLALLLSNRFMPLCKLRLVHPGRHGKNPVSAGGLCRVANTGLKGMGRGPVDPGLSRYTSRCFLRRAKISLSPS